VRLIDRLDAWGRVVDARWYAAWLERRARRAAERAMSMSVEAVPYVGFALLALWLFSLVR
jgi:hypothetical protein